MKILAICIAPLIKAVDDSTMMSSLLAKVDPIVYSTTKAANRPQTSSLLEQSSMDKSGSILNDSHMSISGIQSPSMLKKFRQPDNPVRLSEKSRIHVAPRIHLAENTAPTVVKTVPDVLVCYLPRDKNSLSVRSCPTSTNPALLSQVLRCSDRLAPTTIIDLINGAQTAPINLRDDLKTAIDSLINMDTPIGIDVTTGSCTDPRDQVTDLNIDMDYMAFVVLNPDVERAAENFASRPSGASYALKAGIVFVGVSKLFPGPSGGPDVRGQVKNGFNAISHCMDDGFCSANEIVQWTKTGTQTDYLVGTSNAFIRLQSAPQQQQSSS